MKNFKSNRMSRSFVTITLAAMAIPFFGSCDNVSRDDMLSPTGTSQSAVVLSVTPESVARMLSGIPISIDQVREVFQGVEASSAIGYDEEYTFGNIFSSTSRGVSVSLGQMIS